MLNASPCSFLLLLPKVVRQKVVSKYTRFQKGVHFLMLNISKISRRFFCKFGMVSPKYIIHRSNIKPIPCWAEIFALYGNT